MVPTYQFPCMRILFSPDSRLLEGAEKLGKVIRVLGETQCEVLLPLRLGLETIELEAGLGCLVFLFAPLVN